MRAREADKALIAAWTRATNPPSTYHWPIQPEHNYLGMPSDGEHGT
jgi:hypothetical protein